MNSLLEFPKSLSWPSLDNWSLAMPATEKKDAIVVFTAQSTAEILESHGSEPWVLNRARAQDCEWLICTQNRHHPDLENLSSYQLDLHGTGFLIARITQLKKSEVGDGSRWKIAFLEYARINKPGLWNGQRFPVSYRSLKELDIDPEQFEFERLSIIKAKPAVIASSNAGLTIAEAKKQLAATFGVKPDAIEITIRG
jgi:hypothetical protein